MPGRLMRRFADELTTIADHVGGPSQLAEQAGSLLGKAIDLDRLLEAREREPDQDRYRQHILHVDPHGRFSVVALVWLPGQATPIHDHVAWCVTGIHAGSEWEQRYEAVSRGGRSLRLRPTDTLCNSPGTVTALPTLGRDIHRVSCAGEERAISLHIYGADIGRLGSSINVTYGEHAVDATAFTELSVRR